MRDQNIFYCRCFHLEIVGSDVPFLHYLCRKCLHTKFGYNFVYIWCKFKYFSASCLQTQGLAPVIPRSLNSFFGAHCIGYPLVIISFSLRYYFKWVFSSFLLLLLDLWWYISFAALVHFVHQYSFSPYEIFFPSSCLIAVHLLFFFRLIFIFW